MKNIFLNRPVKKLNKPAGFSLIEVIVATCVFLILVNMAFITLNTGMNSWFTGDTAVELRNEIIKAFSAMEKELKRTGPPPHIDLDSGESASFVNFYLPADVDGDGTVINWNGVAPRYEPFTEWSTTVITYELNANGEIIRRTSLGQSRVLARNISSLQFSTSAVASDILQIDISAQKRDAKGRIVIDTAQLLVKMRNN